MTEYAVGFSTHHEENAMDALPISGAIPTWLRGTLVRNGPGRFELDKITYNHWFDGLAMLHRFTINEGQVSYASRFLHSDDYRHSVGEGTPHMRAFATDPCMTRFGRLMTVFKPNMTDNANIHVMRMADEFLALTESPYAVEFDPITLRTKSHKVFADHVLQRATTTAHPHVDPQTGEIVNVAVRFNFPRSLYRVYAHFPTDKKRRVLAEVPVTRPAYMHSFGMTARYVIIAEFPFTVNALDLAFSVRAFIQNYVWQPEDPTRFVVIDRERGQLVKTFEAAACFGFHHINAYEEDNDLVVDMAVYDDTTPIDELYLDRVRAGNPTNFASGEARRYRLNMTSGAATETLLSNTLIELPRINETYNMQPYRYTYGMSVNTTEYAGFANQLAKIDVQSGKAQTWYRQGCYPGEPVFVEAPDAEHEDEGAVLSVVLDTHAQNSFLLVLDAQTMTEIGRATVPHTIPFGFHGQFFGGVLES